jgi:adenosylcobinamide amidohydrolase
VNPPVAEFAYRDEDGRRLPVHIWRFSRPALCIASGPLGGGIAVQNWVINATVNADYGRMDPDAHLLDMARGLGLAGPGVGLLTAVDVREAVAANDDGVRVVATVGLGHPTWAAAPDGDRRDPSPGTINILAWVPVALSEAALVNAASTITEAKTQALWAYGVEATGTATDALCVACVRDGSGEPYGGPRSVWGARLARAAQAAVRDGTGRWLDRHGTGRPGSVESDSLGTTPGSPETRRRAGPPYCDGPVL